MICFIAALIAASVFAVRGTVRDLDAGKAKEVVLVIIAAAITMAIGILYFLEPDNFSLARPLMSQDDLGGTK